jgi:hypothetical protein
MKASEFDEKFDLGEDITEFLDVAAARRPGYEQKRVNVDFPTWMIEARLPGSKAFGCHSPINHQSLDCGTS